jgi:hypothetical protein
MFFLKEKKNHMTIFFFKFYFLKCSESKFNYFQRLGKTKRLKQAKDEATDEIEKYRNDREKQFKDFEQKVRLSAAVLYPFANVILLPNSTLDHVKVLHLKLKLTPK